MPPGSMRSRMIDVVAFRGGEKEPVTAVVGVIDGVAFLAQPLSDELRHALIVLDQQDFH